MSAASSKANESAFPIPTIIGIGGAVHDFTGVGGLTKREWFAGMAWESQLREAEEWYKAGNQTDVYERAARGSVKAADALLAALQEKPK